MPAKHHWDYLSLCKAEVRGPILIVGSKMYDFDAADFRKLLNSWGITEITGIDISAGDGVDKVVDICETESGFLKEKEGAFNTIICMQVLYAVKDPFAAAANICRLMAPGGTLVFSDVFSHKIHRIPGDYWRFSYDAHKVLFRELEFDDALARLALTRLGEMRPLSYPFPEVLRFEKNPEESWAGFLLRKIHLKLFGGNLFKAARFLPEISIMSLAKKKK